MATKWTTTKNYKFVKMGWQELSLESEVTRWAYKNKTKFKNIGTVYKRLKWDGHDTRLGKKNKNGLELWPNSTWEMEKKQR